MARTILYQDAINEALDQEMARDESVIVMGSSVPQSAQKRLVDGFSESHLGHFIQSGLGSGLCSSLRILA